MSNDYFDAGDYTAPTKNTLARASSVSTLASALEAAFDKLPGETQLKQNSATYAIDSGSADSYVVTLSPAPAAYAAGMQILMRVAHTNTGASTVNANSLGAVSIVDNVTGGALTAGQLVENMIADLRHDGTRFRLMNPAAAGSGGSGIGEP